MDREDDELRDLELLPDAETIARLKQKGAASLWGVAPVAPLHLGYDPLIVAQQRLIAAGFSHTILIADYHALLGHGYTWEEASARAAYYECYLRYCCGLDARFVRGSSFQTRPDYVESLYSAMSALPVSRVKESLPRALKARQDFSPMVSAYVFPLMECLDCHYLGAEVVFAERSQQRVYELLTELPVNGLQEIEEVTDDAPGSSRRGLSPAFVYAHDGHDIKGEPLIQSSAGTRISIHETRESLDRKIHEMFAAPPGEDLPEGHVNALIETFKYSVFPWRTAAIQVAAQGGGQRTYESFETFATDYAAGLLHPSDCKETLLSALWDRLSRTQSQMGSGVCRWVDLAEARGEK